MRAPGGEGANYTLNRPRLQKRLFRGSWRGSDRRERVHAGRAPRRPRIVPIAAQNGLRGPQERLKVYRACGEAQDGPGGRQERASEIAHQDSTLQVGKRQWGGGVGGVGARPRRGGGELHAKPPPAPEKALPRLLERLRPPREGPRCKRTRTAQDRPNSCPERSEKAAREAEESSKIAAERTRTAEEGPK